MKKIFIFLLFSLLSFSLYSQSSNVSDTINIYGKKYIEKTIFINESSYMKMFKRLDGKQVDSVKIKNKYQKNNIKFDSIFQKEMKKINAINENN